MFETCKEYTKLGIHAHALMELWVIDGATTEVELRLRDILVRRLELDAICRNETGKGIESFIDGMKQLLSCLHHRRSYTWP